MEGKAPASGPTSQYWSKPQDLADVDLPDITPATHHVPPAPAQQRTPVVPAPVTAPPPAVPAPPALPPAAIPVVPAPAAAPVARARTPAQIRSPLPTDAPPALPSPLDLTPLPGSLDTPVELPLVPAAPAAPPAATQADAADDWDDPALTGGTYKSDVVVRSMGEPVPVPRTETLRPSTALISANPDIALQDPNWVASQPATGRGTPRYEFIDPNRKEDGSLGDGREALARIEAREAERRQVAAAALQRAEEARAEEQRLAMERARERQRREVEEYQRRQREIEKALKVALNTVEQAMRDAADAFLALSICPDHLEFMQGTGVPGDPWCYVSWQGRVYTYDELLVLKDEGGALRYQPGARSAEAPPVFHSARERRWGLDQPVPPDAEVVVVERALPVVRRHRDGNVRHSSTQASTVLMEEGLVNAYVSGPRVFLWSHLAAARRAHDLHSRLTHRLAAGLGLGAKQMAGVTEAAGKVARGVAEGKVVDAAGTVIDSISSGVGKVEDAVKGLTTRLFRRRPPPG